MRLIIIIMTTCLLQVSASSFGQQVTLSEKNVPLEKIFQLIRQQTGYDFLYDGKEIQSAKPVDVNFKNLDLRGALKKCLEDQGFDFEIGDKSVVVTKRISSLMDRIAGVLTNIDVRGRVTDESGNALPGAVIKVKGTSRSTSANDKGEFFLGNVDEKAVLIIAYVGYETREVSAAKDLGMVSLKLANNALEEVNVTVNTGYQMLPKERATGSFVVLDSTLINRRVSTNIIDRLDGVTSGLLFNGTGNQNRKLVQWVPSTNNLGINIRGQSTLSGAVSVDPLIVVDNFPFTGDINSINPNDVENITVLKDAAAASIWGAQSGNGVIVITTKKGKYNNKPTIDFNTNITISNKPNLYYNRNYLPSSNYIEVEKFLFQEGYFNSDLTNRNSYPALSPVIEALNNLKLGKISQVQADGLINELKGVDVRDDYSKYVYQKAVSQQYSLGIRGGGKDMTYAVSVGLDHNRDNLIRNGFQRYTLSASNTYTPIKNLELSVALNYSTSKTTQNNQLGFGMGNIGYPSKYGPFFPYAGLVDENGNQAVVTHAYRDSYVDSTSNSGFLDWHYRPLQEINVADNYTKVNNILMKAGIKYKFTSYLNLNVQYQNEKQKVNTWNNQSKESFYARNLVNQFSIKNPDGSFLYQVPVGGILDVGNFDWNTNNLRAQLNFDKEIANQHVITAILGAELREQKVDGYNARFFGYDDQIASSNNYINSYDFLPINPNSYGIIPAGGGITSTINRYISYYSNIGYTYKNRYNFTISGRKDGSNIFGVNTNHKIIPLWSTGVGWNISNEDFYDLRMIPYLKLRATYGYNGNVYNGSAYVTGGYGTNDLNKAPELNRIQGPNPELRWEKIETINVGLDFTLIKRILSGTIEYFQKNGKDLVQQGEVAPSTGFYSLYKNSASTKAHGFDVNLVSSNLKQDLKWTTNYMLSTLKDKVTDFDLKPASLGYGNYGYFIEKPIYAVFGYKWAGLDPVNGDPRGYLNGRVSKEYTSILKNVAPDSLVYKGSGRPTIYGSIRNDFEYKGVSLSINISYKFGYYFRRNSITTNYTDILSNGGNLDYSKRWKAPGDEVNTNVPSLVYPLNNARDNFYRFSEVLIEKGDHIRLQDIRLGYDVNRLFTRKSFSLFQAYVYASNLGILWRANKYQIDPDLSGGNFVLPNPFQIAFGVKINY